MQKRTNSETHLLIDEQNKCMMNDPTICAADFSGLIDEIKKQIEAGQDEE